MMMPPDRIELWPLARLKPYARNAKTHDPDQVAKIAASGLSATKESELGFPSGFRCASHGYAHRNIFHRFV